jgi:hypothetical protein
VRPLDSEAGRLGSGKGESQQARAQQHDARRGQRQESAGNCILVLHGYTCHSRCWSELIKDFGTGFLNVQS